MQKDLTFIVPMYNVAAYLARCLDSLVLQNQDIAKEIILIDDGSPDNSLQIAQEYQARYPEIVIIQQHNGGVSAARNAGLRLATGRYVYFIDPDDVLLENEMGAMIALADQHQADMLKGMVVHSYDDGRPEQIRPPESPKFTHMNQHAITTGFQHLHNMLRSDWFPAIWFGFFRRAFLQQNQLTFLLNAKISEDQLLLTRALTSSPDVRVIEVSRLFYNYAHHADTATTKHDYIAGFESSFVQVADALNQHYQEFAKKFIDVYNNAPPPRKRAGSQRFAARHGTQLWRGVPSSIYAFQRARQAASATFVYARNRAIYAIVFGLSGYFVTRKSRFIV